MLTLGIETSCDETAAAVVRNGRQILSNVIASQIDLHKKTGGVVPEVAAREHVVKIAPVIEEALREAKITLRDIDLIAVTAGPGLLSSLLIGVNAAMTLSMVFKKPLVPVNHVEGHIYANWLKPDMVRQLDKLAAGGAHHDRHTPRFPIAILTVSGGHNELLIMRGHGDYQFLGATLDDAAGEAFDKVARLLGLGYPGGPAIQKAAVNGDPTKYPLPRAWLSHGSWDFSFSGLKTSVLYLLKKIKLTRQTACDIAASFQESVCEVLATKLVRAAKVAPPTLRSAGHSLLASPRLGLAKEFKTKEIHLAGGVSANLRLREWALSLRAPLSGAKQSGAKSPSQATDLPILRFPSSLSLCTDNAAMIAAAGFYKYKKSPSKFRKWQPIIADPNLEIENWKIS